MNRFIKYVFFFILGLFFCACNRTTSPGSLVNMEYAKDTTFLFEFVDYGEIPLSEIDSTISVYYNADIVETEDRLLYVSYNLKMNTLDVYDLNTKKRVHRKKYDLEQDSFGRLTSITIENLDTIIFIQEYRLSLGDTGKIYWSAEINSRSLDTFARYHIQDYSNGLFRSNLEGDKIYLPMNCANLYRTKTAFYKRPIQGYYDLSAKKVVEMPELFYSDIFMGKNNYGYIIEFFKCTNANLNCFAFTPDPYLTVFNVKTKEKRTVNARSSYQLADIAAFKAKVPKMESEEKMTHLKTAGGYRDLLYDNYRKLYYRMFMIPQPLKTDDGFYTDYADYKVVLMVLDEDFKLKKEILLPSDFESFFFVTKEGIMHQVYTRKKPNEMKFKLLKILKTEE